MRCCCYFLWLTAILFYSCTVGRVNGLRVATLQESYCSPPAYIRISKAGVTGSTPEVLEKNKVLRPYFSDQSILILHALDLTADMYRQVAAGKDTLMADRVEMTVTGSKIHSRILMALSEINAAAAELDCEGERTDQIAAYIDNINSSRNNRLVVASIALGAVAAIAGALIENDGLNKGVAIGAGVAGAGLGLSTLNPKGKSVSFYHRRNLLRDVWRQEVSGDFTPFVAYMLTEKKFSNSGTSSLLLNLKNRWVAYQFNGSEQDGNKSVIFSDGGRYTAADLHARSAMINQLQAVIRSVNQQINYLLVEMNGQ
ncbi:hypothetical protein [Chitinophaga solisilvae]|uniref:hypothetical protein n=1 Tax=Chitinophaga solisilvae TaxID=1233460 RepID=UPI00136C8A48|nr:hypothetical protein [Chitinophaga solisilvae]